MAGDFDFTTTGFKLNGFADLFRAIDHLPSAVLKAELEPLLARSLEPMRVYAATLAPDDPLTGPPYDLPTSITVSTRQRSGRAKQDRAMGRYSARAYMGPTKFGYPEAIFAEFGTAERFWKPPGAVKSTGAMGATPYMRPAWDSQKQVALKIIEDNFATRVNEIALRWGPKGA